MKFVLKLADQQIFYDEKHVYIDGNMCASYNNTQVVWLPNNLPLAELKHYRDNTWTLAKRFDNCMFEAHDRDKLLRNLSYNEIIGSYTGSHTGALASYISYKHYLSIGGIPKTSTEVKNTQHRKTAIENKAPQPSIKQAEQKVERPITPKAKNQSPNEAEQKYIPPKQELPKIERRYEEPPIYEQPKFEPEYSKPNFTPPSVPIPSGSSEESDGCLGPIAGLAIGILVLIIAIKLIPQSWKDLGTYIPEGDTGIIICFFSSLLGGIISVLMSIFIKECKFTSCLSAFLITCLIGIILNIVILFGDLYNGTVEFTGFFLFDIPLAIFAPILGCFQFAFPIGIVAAIICGIICLIKKKS